MSQMSKIGQYQVVDVVSMTAGGTVSTVRMPQRSGVLFALKQLKSVHTDPDEPQWDSQLFLDRARVQKSVVAAGGRYWLPIHDMGTTKEGAWVVYDYYPLTAQKLIDGRMQLGAPQLHQIVQSVVKGLVELQQARGRAHGNLKASNIIIESGDLGQSRVFLTDPAHGTLHNEADDLYALGELIYQLVVRRPASPDAPMAASEGWDRLGKNADRWRELCADLMAPDPGSRPKLADVSWLVGELGPKRRLRPSFRVPRKVRLAPLAAAVLVVVGLAVVAAMTSYARREVKSAESAWANEFSLALANPARRTHYNEDPDLKSAVSHLERADAARAGMGSGWVTAINPLELARARRAASELRAARQTFTVDHWGRLSGLSAVRQQYVVRGWAQPANYIGNLVASAVAVGPNFADAVDRVLVVQPMIRKDQEQIEAGWIQLNESAHKLEKTGDRTLSAFARSLRKSAGASIRLSDAGFSGLDGLKSSGALAGRLAQAIPTDWPGNIDVRRMAADLGASLDLAHPTQTDIETWLAAVPLYTVRQAETSLAAAKLQKRLKEIDETVAKTQPEAEDKQAYDKTRGQIVARIDAFGRTPFIEKEFEDGLVSGRSGAIESELEALRRYARPETVADLTKNLLPLTTRSKRINDYWETWKHAELTDRGQGAERRANLAMLKARSEELRSLLTDLDQELPETPADLPDAFRTIAARQREDQILRLLGTLDPKSPQLDALRLATAAASLNEWDKSLHRLAQDFPIKKPFLTPDDKPDEKWSGQAGFWDNPLVQELVKGDVARLTALRQLSEAPRAELVDAARSSDSPEMAFEAWRQLGQGRITPPWPTGPQEVAAERDLRRRLDGLLAKVPAPDRDAPGGAIRAQGPVRWRGAVERAADEQTLAAAWEARDAFGVGVAQTESLAPRARFNLWLWRTRESLAANDEPALRESVDQLARASAGLTDAPAAAAALSAALNKPAERQPFGSQPPGDRVMVALAGAQPPVEFRRVEVPDGRPVYLATTEVSTGQFMAAVDAARAWKDAAQLSWPAHPGEPDLRHGPRAWEWAAAGTTPRLAIPQLWLAREEDNDFAPGLRAERFNRMTLKADVGGMPSPAHPMQQVSAQTALWFAGLCGCRLPTSREWLAAYERYGKIVPAEQTNLRDLTWELQRQYASSGKSMASQPQQSQGAWPFDDVYHPDDGRIQAAPADMRTRPSGDGALFFRPVDSGGGSVFHHLAGNVAEYLCEDWERFESLPDPRSPQAISSFASEAAGGMGVVGGSALSPPDVPTDRPIPLTRTDRGFADVGFRLALSAPPRSLAEKVKWALAGQDYVWPTKNVDTQPHAAQAGIGH